MESAAMVIRIGAQIATMLVARATGEAIAINAARRSGLISNGTYMTGILVFIYRSASLRQATKRHLSQIVLTDPPFLRLRRLPQARVRQMVFIAVLTE